MQIIPLWTGYSRVGLFFFPDFRDVVLEVRSVLSKTMKDGDVTELVRNLGDLLSPFTVLHSALGTLHLDHLLAVNTFAWL